MYTCIVVDDSLIERDLMAIHVSKIKNLRLLAECSNGLEALEIIQTQEIDIVFSDIDMPELSGIALVKNLKKAPVFVFITSYADYAVESYNLDVIDFVVKPAGFERIVKAANKAMEYIDLKRHQIGSETPAIAAPKVEQDFFFVKENNGYLKITHQEVAFIESMGDFSKINTLDEKVHIVLVSLKNIAEQLPDAIFKRVHKQFIINLQHIKSIAPTEITLSNQKVVPLSNSYKAEIMDKMVDQNTLKRFT